VDEIPFDFNRKRLSVVVRRAIAGKSEENLLIAKGEAEGIFTICESVMVGGAPQPFDAARRAAAQATLQKLGAEGYRAIGVAMLHVEKREVFTLADERAMTLVGLAAFLDPPKEGVLAVVEALKQNGISVVIMTGDNQYVTRKIAQDVGLSTERILVGNELDAMDDAAVAYQAENGAIFTRVSPEQKNRVILALKSRGHVVAIWATALMMRLPCTPPTSASPS